jgi:3-deoxy-D-manno-octulosonic-acid transferase
LHLARRARRGKEIRERLPERWGAEASPRPAGRLLWVHAASVGETVSVLPVLSALARAPAPPHVVFTTGTCTSAALLEARLPALGLAGLVRHRFAPLDVPRWAAAFLDHWRPDAAAFVESELWPNLLAACRARRLKLALLNARMSARSLAGWRLLPGLAREMLGSFDLIQARSAEDAARLRILGARAAVTEGDLKFASPALPADPAELQRLQHALAGRPVWLAASTHPGEEDAVLAAHEKLAEKHSGLLTIIVPRHPERGAAIPGPRRSLGQAPPDASGVYVADTIGELGLFYRLAVCAFVGGSLVPLGGQNPLEAARLGRPVAMGPHTGNFAEAVAALEAAGALTLVRGTGSLAAWADTLLKAPEKARAHGAAGSVAARRWEGLPERTARLLLDLLG